ncbi:TonB-dependent receptor [Gluconacetobacter sacchari]|uniref:TonB-dependent receptor n=1 Tax=Gluconacetobacter sacchari TaxID=92759 RepID=UPI0039B55764
MTSSRNLYRLSPGGGMMRHETAAHTIQSVSRAYIETQSPTSTALDLVRNLPSVNVSTPDPGGIQGGSITSRGMSENDIGLVINGAPVANGSAAAANRFVNSYIDSENIDVESMTPGSIDVNYPLTSGAAGALTISSRNPNGTFGGRAAFSYGSYDLTKEFLRVDSGEIGHSGIKTYVSVSHTRERNWRGSGMADRKHLDFQAQKNFENGSSSNLFFGYTHQFNYLFKYPTLAQFEADKHDRPLASPINYTDSFNPASPASYYRSNPSDMDVFYLSMPLKFRLSHIFSLNITPYYDQANITNGASSILTEGSTYSGPDHVAVDLNGDGKISSTTKRIVSNPSITVNQQGGVVAALAWNVANHEGQVGYWYERYSYQTLGPVSMMNQLSGGIPAFGDTSAYYQTTAGNTYYSVNNVTGYELHSGFVQDTAHFLNHKLDITGGVKVVAMTLRMQNNLPGAVPSASNTFVAPMPRMAVTYRFNSRHQIYFDAEGDFRAPSSGTLATGYSIATGKISTNGAAPKPQYSIKEELGYRYSGNHLIADVSLYNFNITNRLLSLNTFSNNVQVGETVNAGGATVRGVDVMLSTTPIQKYFSPYVSFEYLHARTDTNLPVAASNGVMDYLHSAGKKPVMTPSIMGSLGLNYDNGSVFINASVHYTGRQYSTFMNDQSIPGFWSDSIAIGYKFHRFWIAQTPRFQLNFTNVTGAYTLNGIRSFSTNALATRGVNGNPIAAAAAPTYYPTPNFTMVGSVSTAF